MNSRVEDRNQGKRGYQKQACGTDVNPYCGYVQQLAKVSAHRCYYCSQDAILRGYYAQAADRVVIRDAARPAPQGKRQSHYPESRLDIEIEVYKWGCHENGG
jgi:hypothetical protein